MLNVHIEFMETQKCVVSLAGDLVFGEIHAFRESLSEAVRVNKMETLILDCTAIKSVDSSGIGFLVALRNAMDKNNVRLILVGVNEMNFGALIRTGLSRKFFTSDSVASALRNKSRLANFQEPPSGTFRAVVPKGHHEG